MIRLFRHDGLEIMLNSDQIKEIRPGPPTVLILLDGETIQVKNTPVDVMTKIRAWRKGKEDEEREFDPFPRRNDRSRKPTMPGPAPVSVAAAATGLEPNERS